jgi:hypothetical protein
VKEFPKVDQEINFDQIRNDWIIIFFEEDVEEISEELEDNEK